VHAGHAGTVDQVDRVILVPSAHQSDKVGIVDGRTVVPGACGCAVDGRQVWVQVYEDGGAYRGPWYVWVFISPRFGVVDIVGG
jgi:hypothetical protein